MAVKNQKKTPLFSASWWMTGCVILKKLFSSDFFILQLT